MIMTTTVSDNNRGNMHKNTSTELGHQQVSSVGGRITPTLAIASWLCWFRALWALKHRVWRCEGTVLCHMVVMACKTLMQELTQARQHALTAVP